LVKRLAATHQSQALGWLWSLDGRALLSVAKGFACGNYFFDFLCSEVNYE
jgi:hypothetical protein